MDRLERERHHRANLERIDQMELVVGRADRCRIDHEGTLLERARLLGEELRSHAATEAGLAALDRLLRVAEERQSPHVGDILAFVAAIRDNRPLSLRTLRGLEQSIGDDMLVVLDAFRYGRLSLAQEVEGGPRRIARLLERSPAGA